ncbi:MAG: hypothetical protein HY791_22960 [Deltaproteobacteria bacterium]|nr:hypothetical protein [Deltaproteobacteria bacterium]
MSSTIDPNAAMINIEQIKSKGEDFNRASDQRRQAQDFMQNLTNPAMMKDIMGVLSNILGMLGGKGI